MTRCAPLLALTLLACGGRSQVEPAAADAKATPPAPPPASAPAITAAPSPPPPSPSAAAAPAAAAPSTPPAGDPLARAAALAPSWEVVSAAAGDINQDGVADLAAVLSRGADDTTTATLKLWFGGADGRMTEAVDAPRAVCASCGGAKGGPVPFEVELNERGVLALTYFGGAREVTSLTTKWRYQQGQPTLIGVVATESDTIGGEVGEVAAIVREANHATRQMTEKVEVVSGPPTSDGALPPTRSTEVRCRFEAPAVTLSGFVFEGYTPPQCSDKRLGG